MPLLYELEHNLKQSTRELRTVSSSCTLPISTRQESASPCATIWRRFHSEGGIRFTSLKIAQDIGGANNIELVIFRVVQEALTNVARHSESSTALIRLARAKSQGAEILLTVEDFGIGMQDRSTHNPGAMSSGLGLISMRERLAQIGGRLQINSAEGHTILHAAIPAH